MLRNVVVLPVLSHFVICTMAYFIQSDAIARANESTRAEYFRLRQECASTMTLRLKEGGSVVAVPFPPPLRLVPDGVSVTWAERKEGLSLRTVRVRWRSDSRDRRGRRRVNEVE
jgi:hypothetical protein